MLNIEEVVLQGKNKSLIATRTAWKYAVFAVHRKSKVQSMEFLILSSNYLLIYLPLSRHINYRACILSRFH